LWREGRLFKTIWWTLLVIINDVSSNCYEHNKNNPNEKKYKILKKKWKKNKSEYYLTEEEVAQLQKDYEKSING
jgi:hypothetical protein